MYIVLHLYIGAQGLGIGEKRRKRAKMGVFASLSADNAPQRLTIALLYNRRTGKIR